jgi:hypothetical protein
MKLSPLLVVVCCLLGGTAFSQSNLIPNYNFSDPVLLKGWRYDFPYQDWYKKNVTYVRQVEYEGRKCAIIDLPPGIAGNEGGKIETALVPAVAGATYRAEMDAALPDLALKVHAEAYAVDPRTEIVRADEESKGTKITIMRIPPMDGHPALVEVYRKQFPDPVGGGKWNTVKTEFTLPSTIIVAGKPSPPAYLTIKAYTYGATMGAGKAYVTNFKLFKIKEPAPGAVVKTIR